MSLTACEKEIFNRILKEELVPATGCTEPVAIAYAAAAAKKALGCEPEVCEAELSGNIIKNARCVAVPNTGGLKGIEAAVAAGVVAGRAELALDVLSAATGREEEIRDFLEKRGVSVRPADNDLTFFIRVTVGAGSSRAKAVIEGFHTNLVLIEKDGIELFRSGAKSNPCCVADRSMLTVEKIVEFADVADLAEIREILERQIAFNSAISEEGLKGDWGANVGKVILKTFGDSPESRLKAVAAAGSDARMGGCDKPVIIVSGSGNQGITASVPVVEYARQKGADRERLLRALIVADLTTIHQKTGIGRLSAYCGAVSAGCGAAAGIAYLNGGGYSEIAHTVVNALAVCSGMICDGAKPSCAAKIAVAVEAGLLGYAMSLNGKEFLDGEGIVVKGVDNTIKNNLETIFNNFREMIKVETVVGQAVQIGGATIIPFVDVTFGFGSGSTESQGSRAGGGGGAKLEPAAVLVIKGDRVEMFSIKKDGYQASAFEKLIAMAPEIIDKMKKDKYIYIKDEDEEAPAADKEK